MEPFSQGTERSTEHIKGFEIRISKRKIRDIVYEKSFDSGQRIVRSI